MFDYKNKTAIVTGASAGIGEVFAKQLAAKGTNLILVARREERLKALSEKLLAQHKITVKVIKADLATREGVQGLIDDVKSQEIQVDILINNAGFGAYGRFDKNPAERYREMNMLNVVALTDLTAAFIPDMVARRSGAIINVASVAGHQPIPYMATYAATKAYVLSFSEALWYEFKDLGVKVMSLDPGYTESEFNIIASGPSFGTPESADKVVALGLQALSDGRASVIAGTANWLTSGILTRLLPRETVVNLAGQMLKSRV